MNKILSLKHYYKVPFRDSYCQTFRHWLATTILCHVVYRLMPPILPKIPLVILLLSLCLPLAAQTNTNTTTSSPGITRIGEDFLAFLTDQNAFAGTNSFRIVAGPVESANHWGGLAEIHVPLAANGQISPGFAVMYLNKTFYDATLNINLNTTFDLFKVFGSTNLSLPLNLGVESGPYVNMHDSSIGAQSGAFQTINTKLGVGQLCVTATEITASTFAKPIYGGLISYGIGATTTVGALSMGTHRPLYFAEFRGAESPEIPWAARNP